ncbi:N-acetyltransferase ESCO2 [Trichinella spiralis]|uniref:N-acetyltransferase ESCO2 n=1 Tax=Trichinella spiralis TaxID=6334 RepID=A0ABR3L0Y5_TRISP
MVAKIVQFPDSFIGKVNLCKGRRLEIAGLLLVEHQHTAFPRVQFMIEERERCRVLMGVVMIWIAPSCRRKKIATRLLDFARNNFLLGTNIQTSQIAFTDLTPAGLKFAENYCHSNILLYHRLLLFIEQQNDDIQIILLKKEREEKKRMNRDE